MKKLISLKKILCLVLCWSGVLLTNAAQAGGSYVGNGGDTLLCQPSSENAFAGYYTLDYLLEYKNTGYSLVESKNFNDTKSRLTKVLKLHYPELYPHFRDFVDQVEESKPGANREWRAIDTGLAEIDDENIQRQIPENCLRLEEGELVPDLHQTVVREAYHSPLRYLYNADILSYQKKNNPLQYSFFMIHEWLWDLTHDVRIIRKLNWLFHSEELARLNRSDFVSLFSSLGLFMPELPLCNRSQLIKDKYPKRCEDLERADLRVVKSLEYRSLTGETLFRVGDFAGFGKVESLAITHSAEVAAKLYPRIFYPLFSLRRLDLSHNDLSELSPEVTRDLVQLEELDLRRNPIKSLSFSMSAMKNLKILKLTHSEGLFIDQEEIEKLPPNLEQLVLESQDSESLQKLKAELAEARPNLEVLIDL